MKNLATKLRWSQVLMGAAAMTIFGADIASAQIEEIMVTARKREESLQSVPVSVSTLSGPELNAQGIRTSLDLGRLVPGLNSNVHPSSASIVTFEIRGQSAGDVLSTVDQAVGVYVDGVYIARPRGMNGAMFDLERVEVLKGPQGTLYGRNTTGGAINFISKGADYDGFHGYASGDAGNDSLFSGRGALNVPIIDDRLAIRVAYQRTTRDGFGDSALTGQEIGQDRDQHFFRGSLVADPFDNVNIEVKGEWYRSRENGNLYITRGLTASAIAPISTAFELGLCDIGCITNIFTAAPTLADLAAIGGGAAALQTFVDLGAADQRTTYFEDPQHDWFESFTLGGTVTIDLGDDMELKSITGLRHFTNRQYFDLDGTPFRILSVGMGQFADGLIRGNAAGAPIAAFQIDPGPEQHAKFFSQEFNISGTGWDGKLDWLGGVYYSNETGSDTQHAQALLGIVSNTFVHDGEKIQNTSWSVYSENTLDLSEWITDGLSLTFGGRYTEERKFLDSHSRNFYHSGGFDAFNGVIVAPNSITCLTGIMGVFPASDESSCFTHNERTFTGFSYLGSLNYQATDDAMLYVKIARSFRGGSFQLRSPTLDPAEPETAREIELGAKTEWLDRRLRVNLAGYFTDYGNKQESIIVTNPDTGGSATIIQNAASASLKGFEGEVSANPFEGLSLQGTISYFSGKYDKFLGALPIQGGAPIDASGEEFSLPKWTYSIGGRYEAPVGPGILGVRADWSWKDGANLPDRLRNPEISDALIREFVATCSGSCSNGTADIGLLSAAVDYTIEDWDTTVTFFVTNLLDKEWGVPGPDPANLGGVITEIIQEPRMWGFRIRKSFGGE